MILEWAATHGLVLLTHDRKTIPLFAYSRVAAGLPMPGVFLVSDDMPIGQAIDELLIAVRCLSQRNARTSSPTSLCELPCRSSCIPNRWVESGESVPIGRYHRTLPASLALDH